MNCYDKWILPRLVDIVMRNKEAACYRAQTVPQARGKIVDLSFDDAIEHVTLALQTAGFGLLADINVAGAMTP